MTFGVDPPLEGLTPAGALARLGDPGLPAAARMFGADAPALLATADGLIGRTVEAARPVQILWSPGKRLVVRYSATVRSDTGTADITLVAATGAAIPETLRDGSATQVIAWARAADPHLPGLPSALDPQTVGRMLTTLGLPPATVNLRLRAYRPTRRAVVQVDHPTATVYLKVVSPREATWLDTIHRFDTGVRTPRTLGVSRDLGIVVLEEIPGSTLREALSDPDAPLPDPRRLLELVDDLQAPDDAPIVGGPRRTVRRNARLVRAVLPECGDLLDSVLAETAVTIDAPRVPVHGDFYESQILVTDDGISGLIDLDRMGIGHRLDDVATMVAHLVAFAQSAPDPLRVTGYASAILDAAVDTHDPDLLRRTVAAGLIGMATGPFRAQAEDWPVAVARRVALAHRWAT
ncbi:MAG TPA: phosphotransferase, partial [Acidimicrobiia bacterium]|nr:phosphotransferase [Acidimicrobiia bacterium]